MKKSVEKKHSKPIPKGPFNLVVDGKVIEPSPEGIPNFDLV